MSKILPKKLAFLYLQKRKIVKFLLQYIIGVANIKY